MMNYLAIFLYGLGVVYINRGDNKGYSHVVLIISILPLFSANIPVVSLIILILGSLLLYIVKEIANTDYRTYIRDYRYPGTIMNNNIPKKPNLNPQGLLSYIVLGIMLVSLSFYLGANIISAQTQDYEPPGPTTSPPSPSPTEAPANSLLVIDNQDQENAEVETTSTVTVTFTVTFTNVTRPPH